jgi:hypothetical protein
LLLLILIFLFVGFFHFCIYFLFSHYFPNHSLVLCYNCTVPAHTVIYYTDLTFSLAPYSIHSPTLPFILLNIQSFFHSTSVKLPDHPLRIQSFIPIKHYWGGT